MTTKEALKVMKLGTKMASRLSQEEVNYYFDNMNVATDMAIEALEFKDKYNWHDLRKNPEDLPELEKNVLVCCSPNNYFVHSLIDRGDTENGTDLCWEDSYGYFIELEDVIAWKEVEPFEEE